MQRWRPIQKIQKKDRAVGQLGLLKSKIVELIRTALIYGSSGIYRSGDRGAGQRRPAHMPVYVYFTCVSLYDVPSVP
jgi:hypothetical protein